MITSYLVYNFNGNDPFQTVPLSPSPRVLHCFVFLFFFLFQRTVEAGGSIGRRSGGRRDGGGVYPTAAAALGLQLATHQDLEEKSEAVASGGGASSTASTASNAGGCVVVLNIVFFIAARCAPPPACPSFPALATRFAVMSNAAGKHGVNEKQLVGRAVEREHDR